MKQTSFFLLLIVLCTVSSVLAAGRTQITVAGGWGFYQMDDLNQYYIEDYMRPFGLLEKDIDDGLNLQADLDYFLTDKFTVGIGASYLSGSSGGDVIIPITGSEGQVEDLVRLDINLKTTAFAPHIRAQYVRKAGSISLSVGAGIAYLFGTASMTIRADTLVSNVKRSYTASGFGLLTNLGAALPLGEKISFSLISGYRAYHTGDLEDDNDPWVVEFDGPPHTMDLDFSGLYVMAGLSVKL